VANRAAAIASKKKRRPGDEGTGRRLAIKGTAESLYPFDGGISMKVLPLKADFDEFASLMDSC
jgi:hypothetical protein